jgi:hypothetical protein
MSGAGQGTPLPAVQRPLFRRLIGVGYAHFNKLRMIVPIANVLEAGKPLFCGLNRSLAAPGRADDDGTLTGSHNDIEPSAKIPNCQYVVGSVGILREMW